MNEIKTFEQFDKKVKELEKEKIRIEEKLKVSRENTENSLKELKEITGKNNIQDIIEYMKEIKAEIDNTQKQIDEEVSKFNEQLKEYGE